MEREIFSDTKQKMDKAIDHYKKDGLLKEVDGLGNIPEITKRIMKALI